MVVTNAKHRLTSTTIFLSEWTWNQSKKKDPNKSRIDSIQHFTWYSIETFAFHTPSQQSKCFSCSQFSIDAFHSWVVALSQLSVHIDFIILIKSRECCLIGCRRQIFKRFVCFLLVSLFLIWKNEFVLFFISLCGFIEPHHVFLSHNLPPYDDDDDESMIYRF